MKLKVCFIGIEIVPINNAFTGGVVNNVLRLAKGLAKRGHEICIITTSLGGSTRELFHWGQLCPIPIRAQYSSVTFGTQFLIRGSFKTLIEHAKRKFDIVNIHSAYPTLALFSLSLRALSLHRPPVVFTLYSTIRTKPLLDRKGLYQRLSTASIARFYLSDADAIVAVSNNVKESLRALGFTNNVCMIPPAVPSEYFYPRKSYHNHEVPSLRISDNSKVILYCGNWAPWKGVDVLLESMAMVVKEFPNVVLILAWNEAYTWYDERKKEVLRLIGHYRLNKIVTQIGIVEDVSRLMAMSDIIILPFLNTDGVVDRPLTLLEAMASGKPVIASKVGGIPEVIQDGKNGFLIEPGDAVGLANAIKMMLKSPSIGERLGKEAANGILLEHSLEVITQKTEKLYNDIIRKCR